jgi:hypothetical protein
MPTVVATSARNSGHRDRRANRRARSALRVAALTSPCRRWYSAVNRAATAEKSARLAEPAVRASRTTSAMAPDGLDCQRTTACRRSDSSRSSLVKALARSARERLAPSPRTSRFFTGGPSPRSQRGPASACRESMIVPDAAVVARIFADRLQPFQVLPDADVGLHIGGSE